MVYYCINIIVYKEGIVMRKKVLPVILAILIAVFFAACSPKTGISQDGTVTSISLKNGTPKETVKNALDALIALDTKTFNQYLDDSGKTEGGVVFKDNKLFGDEPDEDGKKFVKSILSGISYKIVDVKEQGSSAVVQVQITNKDLSGALSTLVKKQGDKELADVINGIQEKKNFDVALPLKKSDTGWKIEMTKEFTNAIMGGAFSDGIFNLFK
jgi:Pyruvate/2-oxoacid:ferredoxin oxidoreductase gamma subunit